MTTRIKPCPGCGGDGRVSVLVRGVPGLDWCPVCDGSGRVPVTEAELEAGGQLNALLPQTEEA